MKCVYKRLFLILILFSCNSKYPLNLGGHYILQEDGSSFLNITDLNNTVIIDSHIIGYNTDSTYIVIEQIPRNIIEKMDTFTRFDDQMKFFLNNPIRQYWIINRLHDSIYGPYNKEQYLLERSILRIPTMLKIIPITDWNNPYDRYK